MILLLVLRWWEIRSWPWTPKTMKLFSRSSLSQWYNDFFLLYNRLWFVISFIVKFYAIPFLGVIAGGTNLGNVAMWHYKGDLNSRAEKQSAQDTLWELLAPSETGAPVVDLKVSISIQRYD